MAEYDGSVRIGVKVELDNAKKQLEHLRNRLADQKKEIDKQASAVQKLKAAFDGLSSKNIQVKGASKLWDDLKLATYEAYRLRNELKRLQEVSKGEIAENGVLSAETASRMEEISTALMEVTASADLFRQKLYKMDIPAEELDRAVDKMRDLADSTISAENGLRDLQLVASGTEQEVQSAEERVDRLSEELQAIKESAVVANQGIVDLTGELSKLKAELDDLKAAGLGPGIKQYDDITTDIKLVEDELKRYQRSLTETAQIEEQNAPMKKLSYDLHKSSGITSLFNSLSAKLGHGVEELFRSPGLYLGKFLDMMDRTAAKLKSLLSTFSNSAAQFYKFGSKIKSFLIFPFKAVADHAKTAHGRMEKIGRSRGLDKAGKSAARLSSRLKNVGKRIVSLAASALIFNVISRGFTELTKQIGAYLMVNKQFVNSLSTIKGNLLTAFQPIYDAVMPALNSLLETLREASAVAAKFVAGLFGTTAEKAQENAKALHDQAKATEEVADETKKAEKFLASFDTIEILGNKEDENKKEDEKEEKAEAKFDQDYSDVKVPAWLEKLGEVIKSIKDALKDLFAPIKEAWDKYGSPVIEALKRAFGAVWDLIKEIGRTFMEIWQSPLVQTTLKLIMDLLTLILNIIGDIADTFRKVWESGEGEKLLTNLFTLLNTILGIIYDIASAFQAAWSNYGESVVKALFFALNSVLELLNAIGQSFREAWNDNIKRGQKIFEIILQIVRDIFNIVGELANRLREAWEANGNGQAIWGAILDSVIHILACIHNITSATHEWAQSIDFEPLISGIRNLLEKISPLIEKIGKTASEIYKETVLPFLSWLIEDAIPRALNLFGKIADFLTDHEGLWNSIKEAVSGAFDFIKELIDATLDWAENLDLDRLASSFQNLMEHIPEFLSILSEIYRDVILPLIEEWLPRLMDLLSAAIDFLSKNKEIVKGFVAAWALSGVVSLVSGLASQLGLVTAALAGAAAAVTTMMQAWGKMNDMERSLAVIGAVMAALGALAVMLFAVKGGVAGVALGVAAVIAGIAMVNSAVNKANSGHSGFSMGMFGGTVGGGRSSIMARIAAYPGIENIPHLAKGAVISPNSEFLAVLGDQRSGTNIEAPLSTIQQAVGDELDRRGYGGGATDVTINFTGSLSQLARILQPQIKVAEQRRGPSLVNIGGDSYG